MNTSKLSITSSSELPVEKRLVNLLGISENAEDDLDFLTDRKMQGSCQWLLQRQAFQDWAADSPNTSGILWLTGILGSGKSTLASFIIAFLKKRSFAGTCHYHFFLMGHQTKRTLSYLLRSVALQAALSHKAFCSRLLELHENTGINFGQQKAIIIWERIFEGILFRLPSQDPLFWVFEGLDEAESPTELIRFLSKLKAATRINVLLVSRATKDLLKDINHYLPTTVHETISADDTVDDIRAMCAPPFNESYPAIIHKMRWCKRLCPKHQDLFCGLSWLWNGSGITGIPRMTFKLHLPRFPKGWNHCTKG